jgi:hypothetical protein
MPTLSEMYDAESKRVYAEVMPDGGTVRVRMTLMDGAPPSVTEDARRALADNKPEITRHAPGSLALSDADRNLKDTLLDACEKRLNDAWRNPPPLEDQSKPAPIADTNDLHAQHRARLEAAWKGAGA